MSATTDFRTLTSDFQPPTSHLGPPREGTAFSGGTRVTRPTLHVGPPYGCAMARRARGLSYRPDFR